MRTPTTGRVSIFRNKNRKNRVQGLMSDVGKREFELARKRLARLAGWQSTKVSDADTVEYLARGHEATRVYLKGQP